MMAGCVPVASRIEGITDFILEEGRTGLLCSIGSDEEFARAIARLHTDRAALTTIGKAAAVAARDRWNCERMSAEYAALFTEIAGGLGPQVTPLPWSRFCLPAPFRPTWRGFIPKPIKRLVRAARYGAERAFTYRFATFGRTPEESGPLARFGQRNARLKENHEL
jgi:hypothetical protein